MSHDIEEQALDRGHDCAMSALAAQREVLERLPPPERLSWWIGFISAAMGAALASVGEAAMRVLKGALVDHGEPPSSKRRARTYVGPDKRKPS